MRIRYLRRPPHRGVCFWLDLDNTLHDASRFILPEINQAMTRYVASHLDLPLQEASTLRNRYWVQYGATLLGMMYHHDVDPHHFLEHTHRLPNLHQQVVKVASIRHHLSRLPGTKILLTNAPREYAERVLRLLGMHRYLHAIVAVENMRIHRQWRPKPASQLWPRLKAAHPSRRHVLVEDTVGHLVAAARHQFGTAWIVPPVLRHQRAKPSSVNLRVASFAEFAKWACRFG